jgi:hypothetical protein
VRITLSGWFDLDHIRSEIREDGACGRACYKAGAVDDFEAIKDSLTHVILFFLLMIQL